MPGVCAVVSSQGNMPAGPFVEVMARRMVHYPWHRTAGSAAPDGRSAVASIALEHMAGRAMFIDPARQTAAVLDGELHDAERERARLKQAGAHFDGDSDAELLLRGYEKEGQAFLARLDGAFSAVIWNGTSSTLTVVTDRFGMRPLYLARSKGIFVVASEIKAVLVAPGVDTSWDETGVAQFFGFGHFFGDNTLHAGVRALPAAVCGEYCAREGTYREERYWTSRSVASAHDVDSAVGALEKALVAAVERRARPGERLGLSLSGGLDARTILALMPSGVDLRTVSLGIEGSLDHRSSSELAALAGVPHRNYVLGAAFLSRFEEHLRQMIRLTDGHYLDQGIVMPAMNVYRELGIEFLHRGHGGELLHMKKAYAFSLDDVALGASEPELETWLFSHLTGYMLGGVPEDLFTFDIRGLVRESLRAALGRTTGGERPVDRVWQLFVNERLHRETALSMHKFGCFAQVRMPFIDRHVIEALSAIPAGMKLDETLQGTVLRHKRPEFLKVRNANTGAPVGASRLAREAGYLRMRVAAKLGVKGYQPYERLGLWLRRDLRNLVSSTLLDEAFLDQRLFRGEAIRRLVSEHLDDKRNHTFLLMSLMIFGLGQELRMRPEQQPSIA